MGNAHISAVSDSTPIPTVQMDVMKRSQSGEGEDAQRLESQESKRGPPTPPPFLIPEVTIAPTGLAGFNSTTEGRGGGGGGGPGRGEGGWI